MLYLQQNAEHSAGGMTARVPIQHAKRFAFNPFRIGRLHAFSIASGLPAHTSKTSKSSKEKEYDIHSYTNRSERL
jgi:hypothetical protein